VRGKNGQSQRILLRYETNPLANARMTVPLELDYLFLYLLKHWSVTVVWYQYVASLPSPCSLYDKGYRGWFKTLSFTSISLDLS
jgi:hypothetical protein